jgi:cation diffusion facilitator family transporter
MSGEHAEDGMADGSTRVVLTALAGNAAIAVAKFVAAGLSGSVAMLTEAIHSLVDTGDQLLLLVGQRRGKRPPDDSHPLGYGMEVYFWSFVVALMVFVLGGVLSIYEGVRHILDPAPVISPWISLGVLAVSAAFEGASFRVGYREYKRVVRGAPVRLWSFIKGSKDPGLVSVLLEDSAALIGIVLAAIGVTASSFFHVAWADGAASVAIGLLLTGVAFVLANETRSLIAGESVAPIVMERLKETLDRINCITQLDEIVTLHLGPGAILVALTLGFRPKATSTSINAAIQEITECLRATDDRVAYVYVRPSHKDQAKTGG